jgi:flagellar biosynthesis protein FlhF
MPETWPRPRRMQWMMEAIRRNLRIPPSTNRPLYEEGGIHALVGATGVGKTTTAAKLAGLCAEIHGPASVGLITLDTQRVGAHEQLREHARDAGPGGAPGARPGGLQDLLGLFAAKKMVLIDTTGTGPARPAQARRARRARPARRAPLLVLNAGAHGDTLDDVVAAFKFRWCAAGASCPRWTKRSNSARRWMWRSATSCSAARRDHGSKSA